jgi:hypothetical protein
VIFLREWKVPGSCTKAKQNFTSFISLRGVLAVPGVDGGGAALAVGEQEGQRGAAMTGKRPGW